MVVGRVVRGPGRAVLGRRRPQPGGVGAGGGQPSRHRPSGGERAAAFYSLIGTAKLNGLDPEAYLRTVLERIAEHPINRVDELLPWHLASAPAEALRQAA